VTLLEEPVDSYRPPASRTSDARSLRSGDRPVRAKAEPDDDAEEPFLRARRRVPVRRGWLPAWLRTTWGKLLLGVSILIVPGLLLALIIAVHSFLDHDPRFRVESSTSIQTIGNSQLSRSDLLSVFGSDIGRNLFFVPLAKRRAALEQIPWVRQATVMRVLPNQLRVAIVERTPIAFVLVHGHVQLADADGVILTLTPQQMAARHDSFAVISGINPADPLSVRRARMQIYQKFVADLDSTGEHISAHLSEVDLSDPEDVRATVPANGSDLLLHFGDQDFLPRWRNYQAHIAQWEQQYPHLAAIDLRYDREVVLRMAGDPGTTGAASNAAPAPDSAPAAAKLTTNPASKPVSTAPAAIHRPAPTEHKSLATPKPTTNSASKPTASIPAATHHPAPAEHKSPAAHNTKNHKPAAAKPRSSHSKKAHVLRRSA
jgi:cell division protein FtsQ